MTNPNDQWLEAWKEGRVAFHRQDVQPDLMECFHSLNLPKGARVLVPLCGKSLDMLWLRDQGFQVVGAELSRLAIEQFFEESKIDVRSVTQEREFKVWSGDQIKILEGDFFSLTPASLGEIQAVYDRASIIALTKEQRKSYGRVMQSSLKPGTKFFMILYEYDQSEMQGPPFSVTLEEVQDLFGSETKMETLRRFSQIEISEHLKAKGLKALSRRILKFELN